MTCKYVKHLERTQKKEVEKKNSDKPKFTAYCKVNSGGTRYEFTQIIEADNEEIATSILKERAKLSFTEKIRNITCISITPFKEGDSDSIIEIEKPKLVEVKEPELQEDEVLIEIPGVGSKVCKKQEIKDIKKLAIFFRALEETNRKLYFLNYLPKKRVNKSHYKNSLMSYIAFDEADARLQLIEELKEHNIIFKEKYIHNFKEYGADDVLKSPILFNEVISRINDNTADNIAQIIERRDINEDSEKTSM